MRKKANNIFLVFAISTIAMLGGCSGVNTYPEHPLSEQVLTPVPGSEGNLVNTVCLKYKGNTCVDQKVTKYALDDPQFREKANRLGFICKLGTKLYSICPDRAGFCRYKYVKKWFLGKTRLEVEDFVPVTNYEFLLQSRARCYSKDEYGIGM